MIKNGKDTKLSCSMALPAVTEGIDFFLQSLKIGIVQKQQIDGRTQEVPMYSCALACLQPMNEKLASQKEGERSWKWFTLYTEPGLKLDTDDIVIIEGTGYRIQSKENWSKYGFVRYDAIQDYKEYTE